MAIARYVYAENDVDWIDTAAERLLKQDQGTNRISYTDYADGAVNLSIATGSYFEVNGSGFLATTDTAVGGSIATGLCYILATGATAAATIAWTTTEPVWRDDLQGYYATIGSTVRAIGGCNYVANSYNDRWVYHHKEGSVRAADLSPDYCQVPVIEDQGGIATNGLYTKVLEIGDWNMETTATKLVPHGLGANYKKIRSLGGIIRDDADEYYSPIPSDWGNDGGLSFLAGTGAGDILGVKETNIGLQRESGSPFNASTFNSTSYNRGWITVWYEK